MSRLELISRTPTSPARPDPLLFVHGAWHAAWCWDEHFLGYFASRGFAVHALSLRGHGNSEGRQRLRRHRIAGYVADVAEVAASLARSPIVIGHSMGGLVVQKYLESHNAPAAALLASAPPAGVLGVTLRLFRHHPLLMLKVNLLRSLYPLLDTPAKAREHLFSPTMPEEQVRAYQRRLQDESYMAFLDMLVFNRPRPAAVKTPMLVLGAANDAIFTPAEVKATARAYHTQATIFPNMAHDMMLEPGWPAVAEAIAGWLEQRPGSAG
jgi:pimeloyl-ACP methyl ester carboxylesterase